MTDIKELQRLRAKTAEQKFLQIMEQGYCHSPRVAEAILEEAQECLEGSREKVKPGQMRKVLVSRSARNGQALRNTKMVEVVWTVDAGLEDLEVRERHGSQGLRQVRIERLLEEAVLQGGVATQEDLAQVLGTSVRTIKRDFEEMKARGIYLPSRGNLQGIGRGQTHKAQIIRRWLSGETYDQLALSTHHCIASIKRYVRTFVQVVQLHRLDMFVEEIALILQIGAPLVGEYLTVYQQNDQPVQRERLESQLERFSKAGEAQKGAI